MPKSYQQRQQQDLASRLEEVKSMELGLEDLVEEATRFQEKNQKQGK